MKTTDKNFRLSKSSKRMLALFKFKTPQDRGVFKKQMIEAEVNAIRAKFAKTKEKE